MKTLGISPKVWQPIAAQFTALVVVLLATGDFDRVTWAQLAGMVLTAGFGWFASPGKVVSDE